MRFVPTHIMVLCVACALSSIAFAQTRTLRIVTYNIGADINGATTPLPGLISPSGDTNAIQLGGVLEGIGEEGVGNDPAQPIDILALQETTANLTTVAPIVSGLNAFYNAPGLYAMSPYQATESGGVADNGNGPNALVYRTTSVQLLASVPVDPPGGTSQLGSRSGEYREVVRCEFAPAGVTPTTANVFYVYVSHYKSGTGSGNEAYRNGEARIIRNDEANNLPADARVIYLGDYNITTGGEASYWTILAINAPDGKTQGRGVDPMNPSGATNINWNTFTTDPKILALETESATVLRYRDDMQLMTSNVYYGATGGLAFVPGTYHVFGNNGTTPYYGSVKSASNTALNDNLEAGARISASQLYLDLTTASDHLPVSADYTIPIAVPAPVLQSVTKEGATIIFTWKAVIGARYQWQHSTDLSSASWTDWGYPMAATNSVMSISDAIGTNSQQFYRLLVR